MGFYRWLRDDIGVHAIVHLGAHGTLEWLPGKAVALSPSCFPAALTDLPFQKDVAKAKQLMKEAGLEDGFEVALDYQSNAPFPDIAQAMQADLAAIGIKLRMLAAEFRQVITKTRARQHELAMLRWGSDYMDPHSNAQTFCMN